ncbi:MAG: hypothetical protein QM763_01855 [Agriterribacter sp.]
MKCPLIIICLILYLDVYAQTQPAAGVEQQLENITEQNEDAETTDDIWIQQIEYFRKNPVNLNTAPYSASICTHKIKPVKNTQVSVASVPLVT